MGEISVDPKSIPTSLGFRSQDFVCSKAFIVAPLGGLNESSIDPSVVLNVPYDSDGEQLVVIWGIPQNAPYYKDQGVIPIPARCFKDKDYNGGRPLISASPTVECAVDGHVYRDGRGNQAFWTDAKNYRRIERNRAEASERAKGGKLRREVEQTSEEFDRYGAKDISFLGEDRFVSPHDVRSDNTMAAELTRPTSGKRVQVSLSGPKKE